MTRHFWAGLLALAGCTGTAPEPTTRTLAWTVRQLPAALEGWDVGPLARPVVGPVSPMPGPPLRTCTIDVCEERQSAVIHPCPEAGRDYYLHQVIRVALCAAALDWAAGDTQRMDDLADELAGMVLDGG